MKRHLIFLITITILTLICGISVGALSKMGSRSDEVAEIQEALKSRGYYGYTVDTEYSAHAPKMPLLPFKGIILSKRTALREKKH